MVRAVAIFSVQMNRPERCLQIYRYMNVRSCRHIYGPSLYGVSNGELDHLFRNRHPSVGRSSLCTMFFFGATVGLEVPLGLAHVEASKFFFTVGK